MSVSSTPEGKSYAVFTATGAHTGGPLEPITLYSSSGAALPIPTKQAAQADTVAADLAALKVDFNLLLAKLRLAGILG